MKVKEFLEHPVFRQAKIVAGAKGLSRSVTSVNIMDAPDITKYITDGQLLLTNAFAIKETPHELVRIIEQMVQNGGAALFIRPKRFLEQIPAEALTVADRLAFPIVELSDDYSLGDVLNQSLESILEKQAGVMRNALNMHKRFSEMVIKGKGLPDICTALSVTLDGHVLLVENDADSYLMSDRLKLAKNRHIVRQITALFHSITDDLLPPGELCLWDARNADVKFEVEFHRTENIPQGVYLVVVRPFARDNAPLKSSLHRLALEQAINVIEFEWMKRNAVKERSRRYKSEFFSDLMEGSITSEKDILNRGKKYIKEVDAPFCCVLAKLHGPLEDQIDYAIPYNRQDFVYNALKRELNKTEMTFVLFTKHDIFGVLITLPGANWESDYSEQLKQAQARLLDRYRIALSFGIGKPVKSLIHIHTSYKESVDALHTGFRVYAEPFVSKFKTKETEEMLRLIPSETLKEYYTSTFHHLLKENDKEVQELQKTLEVFLESHCSISDTSKKLFIHRNTVIYRINKCEKLMQRNVKHPGHSLRIRLAIMIGKLLDN